MVVIMSEPAFPSKALGGLGYTTGMTLRDYFAAKAMQGILTNGGWVSIFVETASKDGPLEDMSGVAWLLSDTAYDFADAMLKVRGDA